MRNKKEKKTLPINNIHIVITCKLKQSEMMNKKFKKISPKFRKEHTVK